MTIPGIIELETGRTVMLEASDVDANSTIRLMEVLEVAYPTKRRIYLFLDDARYCYARSVRDWLQRQGCRIKMRFIQTYCPHLNPIERLWRVMHRNVTHNRDQRTIRDFANAVLGFLRTDVPRKWGAFRDNVSDNFRVIDPGKLQVPN